MVNVDGETYSITHSDGTHWRDQMWSGWSLVGAENINGVNTSAWQYTNGEIWLAEHNSNWVYTGSGGNVWEDVFSQSELHFNQDFNNDSIIGGFLTVHLGDMLIALLQG